MTYADIRNIAIIAHVDHGKTTLVDAMLKQTHTFRANQAEMQQTLIMDSNELEREKGITILAKNTAVYYTDKDGKIIKINIIDTPGHADFGGEVERVLNMADGALLIVDAAEGPLPQTRFVLEKAMQSHLKIIVVINKIDRSDARPLEVLREVESLFLELAQTDKHLDFPVLYAVGREGKAYTQLPENREDNANLRPLFETILKELPSPITGPEEPVQMQISTLDYDNYLGKLCIGRVRRGTLRLGEKVVLVDPTGIKGTYTIEKLFVNRGIEKEVVEEVISGDIATVAGIADLTLGQTLASPDSPEALPMISVGEPTLTVTIGPNTSPLSGKEGKFTTSRQIKERLLKEKETNLGLHIEEDPSGINFLVSGRGELHLAILIETMRREGFELSVSKPEVIIKEEKGAKLEPFEEVVIVIPEQFVGVVTNEFGQRKAEMKDMVSTGKGTMRLVYKISERNLLGVRNTLMTQTKGTMNFSTSFVGFEPLVSASQSQRMGVLVAHEAGVAASYGLVNAQERGTLFIGPGARVYEGMIVGVNNRSEDMGINVCKEKKKTNVRSETAEIDVGLVPPTILSLEQYLDFIADDELLEVTPKNLRPRKKFLTKVDRIRQERKEANV